MSVLVFTLNLLILVWNLFRCVLKRKDAFSRERIAGTVLRYVEPEKVRIWIDGR